MKAEHRKELETNLLADRMGQLVDRMKARPQRRFILLVLVLVVVAVGVGIWYVAHRGGQQELAERWFKLEVGGEPYVDTLAAFQVGETKDKKIIRVPRESEFDNPGKAARLEVARYYLWEYGVKKLATPGKDALNESPMDKIAFAASLYKSLQAEVEDAPEWKAEVLYGLAIIEETNAVRDIKRLDKAKEKFKALATDEALKTTGHGKLAESRLKELDAHYAEVKDFYDTLGKILNIPPETGPLGPRLLK